jgi:hypothetical protein
MDLILMLQKSLFAGFSHCPITAYLQGYLAEFFAALQLQHRLKGYFHHFEATSSPQVR